MRYFPLFMDLADQRVLLVGAGSVAERKARQLMSAGARVAVVARELNSQFEHWVASRAVEHVADHYRVEALGGMRLVFVATRDRELNLRVHADAEARGLPVNVVDDRSLCRFISPAVIDRSPLQIAISTGGTSPVLARRLRAWIEQLLPRDIGRVAEALGRVRRRVKRRVDQADRRRFWEELLTDERIRRWSIQGPGDIDRQLCQAMDARTAAVKQPGRVYLVGAGPGRADLLTLRAMQVLAQADLILHDRLVSAEVLDMARRDADRIDVGRRAGEERDFQAEIHEIMAREAARGRNVVRLKGGDAFIFGRGGEELEYLRRSGIDYEVVPGITAATGCAAYSGIPLTHRDYAQSLTLVTGHRAAGAPEPGYWAGIAGPGRTAVVYMGARQAARIRTDLLADGIDARLPAALILDGTLDRQRVLHGTVDELPALAAQAGEGQAGLLVIGQVAALGVSLGWFAGAPALREVA